ncbi:hypothetical protein DAPPUDRAFT_238292 [Daphnia pulex]|uniref:Uncharacterized protein n=1 Tax=Daphnia pulex TaxID=6669 RepID=E9G616_DAPPU|nr:hypothetical protein DAPPUDRAFT_238292 [Daphnia pulex]|eukprot:EFX85074.1 hypothetical protein DAPPUDRAFT_238292 [Daphnia pulex]
MTILRDQKIPKKKKKKKGNEKNRCRDVKTRSEKMDISRYTTIPLSMVQRDSHMQRRDSGELRLGDLCASEGGIQRSVTHGKTTLQLEKAEEDS